MCIFPSACSPPSQVVLFGLGKPEGGKHREGARAVASEPAPRNGWLQGSLLFWAAQAASEAWDNGHRHAMHRNATFLLPPCFLLWPPESTHPSPTQFLSGTTVSSCTPQHPTPWFLPCMCLFSPFLSFPFILPLLHALVVPGTSYHPPLRVLWHSFPSKIPISRYPLPHSVCKRIVGFTPAPPGEGMMQRRFCERRLLFHAVDRNPTLISADRHHWTSLQTDRHPSTRYKCSNNANRICLSPSGKTDTSNSADSTFF